MNILLDSHAFLWFVADDLKLSIDARTAIEDSTNRKWISIASLWEITIKVRIGKLNLADPVSEFLSREILCNKFSTLNVTIAKLTGEEFEWKLIELRWREAGDYQIEVTAGDLPTRSENSGLFRLSVPTKEAGND